MKSSENPKDQDNIRNCEYDLSLDSLIKSLRHKNLATEADTLKDAASKFERSIERLTKNDIPKFKEKMNITFGLLNAGLNKLSKEINNNNNEAIKHELNSLLRIFEESTPTFTDREKVLPHKTGLSR